MNQLKILKVIDTYRKPGSLGVSINDIDKYLNYEDVKHWFYVGGFVSNWFYVAIYDSLLVGYYFRNTNIGGRVEVLPDFRKNGTYGHLNVYQELLNRITERFPNEFYSTVGCLNIPSLSSHFKNKFKIDVVNHYENEKDNFISKLIGKKVFGKVTTEEVSKESKRKIRLKLYYEFGGRFFRYDDKNNFYNIKQLFINHSRELKCYVLTRKGKVYLEKINNEFEFPEGYKNKFNVYEVKYKLTYPKKIITKKTKLNIENVDKFNFTDWINQFKSFNVNYRLTIEIKKREVKIKEAIRRRKKIVMKEKIEKLKAEKLQKIENKKVEKIRKEEDKKIRDFNIKYKISKMMWVDKSDKSEMGKLRNEIAEKAEQLKGSDIEKIRKNLIKAVEKLRKENTLKTKIVPRGTKKSSKKELSNTELKKVTAGVKNKVVVKGFINPKPKKEEFFKKKELSDDDKGTLWGKILDDINLANSE